MNAYPYFVYPLITEFATTSDPARREELKELIAANITFPGALASPIDGLDLKGKIIKKEQPRSKEDATIDSFIEKFGRPGENTLDAPLLPETPSASDYFAALEQEAAKNSARENENEANSMEEVKICIKKGDFDGALSIMNQIYLNNPKKSIYFADQIRFLKKLKLNEDKKRN